MTIIHRNRVIILSYLVAMIMLVVVNFLRPGFASPDNLRNLSVQAGIIGLISLGQTMVILIGGIDLSIPWNLNAAALLLSLSTGTNSSHLLWSVPAVLALSTVVGTINGLGVALLGISPVVMTLGTNTILEGALISLTQGSYGQIAPGVIQHLAIGTMDGIPIFLVVWIAVIVAISVLLSLTRFGRQFYALGNSPTVALFSGINVRYLQVVAYAVSGLCAGFAGVMLLGYVGQSYLGMGDPYLFPSIAAVAVGGASMLGGSGNYLGTVAGAFILTILTGLLPVFGLTQWAQEVIYGFVVLGAVILARQQSQVRG